MATLLTLPRPAGTFSVFATQPGVRNANVAASRRGEVVKSDSSRTSVLIDLVYELLDAHTDTVVLASNINEPAWEAHTDYVRALHRRGHEILAVSARQAAYADSVAPASTEDVPE
jgi:hypothetical protein